MRRIHSPIPTVADRQGECRRALEPAFMQLVERAEAAGWSRQEVALAAVLLASQALEESPSVETAETDRAA